MKNITYHFQTIAHCNMCGAPASRHRVLGRRMNVSQGFRVRSALGLSTTVMQCRSCNLIFSNPLPVPNNINDHYGVPPESYWIPEYFEVHPDYFAHQIDVFRQLHRTPQGPKDALRALDVGAGIGKAMIALERAGFKVEGFEPSLPFYERAIERMNISPDHIRIGGIEENDYAAESFDFIAFSAVLEHIYDPSAAILKALGWLKPGGLIFIEVPSSRWLISKLFNSFYRLSGTDYVTNISPMHSPFHLYEFDRPSFTRHARHHGYSIAHMQTVVAETMLPKRFDPVLKPIMERGKTGMQLEIWLRK